MPLKSNDPIYLYPYSQKMGDADLGKQVFFGVRAAARELGVYPNTIIGKIKRGTIEHIKVNGRPFISETVLISQKKRDDETVPPTVFHITGPMFTIATERESAVLPIIKSFRNGSFEMRDDTHIPPHVQEIILRGQKKALIDGRVEEIVDIGPYLITGQPAINIEEGLYSATNGLNMSAKAPLPKSLKECRVSTVIFHYRDKPLEQGTKGLFISTEAKFQQIKESFLQANDNTAWAAEREKYFGGLSFSPLETPPEVKREVIEETEEWRKIREKRSYTIFKAQNYQLID